MFTISIVKLFNIIGKFWLDILFDLLKSIALVFAVFKSSLLADNQSFIAISSLLIEWCKLVMLLVLRVILVSSANNISLAFEAKGISLMYIRNRSGPKMEPWGTPIVTGSRLDG